MTGSFADETQATKQMVYGLKANVDQLTKRGLDKAFVDGLESAYTKTLTLNSEQQSLKARLKERTAAVNEAVVEMRKMRREARKLVKVEMAQESWKEFGIQVSR